MRQRPLRLVSIVLALFAVAGLAACAQGTGDSVTPHPDAHVGSGGGPDANFNQTADAAPIGTPDAFSPADAFVPPTPDADTSGGSCTSSAQCTTAPLTCCIDLGSGGICFLDPGIPGICL